MQNMLGELAFPALLKEPMRKKEQGLGLEKHGEELGSSIASASPIFLHGHPSKHRLD